MAKVPVAARKHLHKAKQEGYVGQANGRAIDVPHTPGSVSERQSLTSPWSPVAQISVDPGVEEFEIELAAHEAPASLEEEEVAERKHTEKKEDDDEDLLRTEEKRQKRRIFEIETAAQKARPAALSPQRTFWGLFQRSPTNPPLSSARTMDAKLISGDVNKDDFRDEQVWPFSIYTLLPFTYTHTHMCV